MDREAGTAIPDDRGFSLVRDTDSAHIGPGSLCGRQRLLHDRDTDGPEILGVVFHPTRLGIVLRNLVVAAPDDVTVFGQYEGCASGGSLIECEDDGAHISP